MGKFIIRQNHGGYTFQLKANNGETIGTSETYSSLSNCKEGINAIKHLVSDAPIEDQTMDQHITNPKYEIYEDLSGHFRFRLKAVNGEIILSSEGYTSKASCKNGIESVRINAVMSQIEIMEMEPV